MWHLTFLVPAQAVLSLTSACSFPSSRGGHSWTRCVFTVHGDGSSFFFEVRQGFGLGGGRGLRDEGEEMSLLCQLSWLGGDMRCGHCRVWILGALCLRRWNLSWLHKSHHLNVLDLTIHGGFAMGGKEFWVSLQEKQHLHGVYMKRMKSEKGSMFVFQHLLFCKITAKWEIGRKWCCTKNSCSLENNIADGFYCHEHLPSFSLSDSEFSGIKWVPQSLNTP